jgi:DNA-binding MarR family transcriptional regulator
MQRETVKFSLQLAAVFLAHRRSLSLFFRERYGLSYSEIAVSLALHEANAPVLLMPLTDYLMLSRKTVLTILDSLEAKRLILKKNYPADRRLMSICLTAQGKELADQALAGLNELVRDIFLVALPKEDFTRFMSGSIKSGIDALRGHPAPKAFASYGDSVIIGVDFLIYWRVLYDRWENIVRAESHLSFNSFRVAALLDESDNLSPFDIAEHLLAQRSEIAVCKTRLLSHGLIREKRDVSDGRRRILAITAKGHKLVRSMSARLDEITRKAHSHISDENRAVLNAWYYRMYSNLRAARHLTF